MLQSNAWPTLKPPELPTHRSHCSASGRAVDEGELPHLYDYPEQLDGIWVRANFITSVDGGATADGTSGGLGGPGDKLIFNVLRELADVIVVGAGTVRMEGYSGAHPPVAQRMHRQARGPKRSPAAGDRHQVGPPGPGYARVHPHRGAALDLHLRGGLR